MMEKTSVSLKEVWAEFRQKNPGTRIREAARILGVSEAELLATGIGENATLLEGDFRELLKQAGSLGKVMALTRNECCVHERKGVYEQVSFNNHVGLALGPDIDLRLFMNRWKSGFAVREKDRRSLQFFSREGTAVHKIYLTGDSDGEAYGKLVAAYQAPVQEAPLFAGAAHPSRSAESSHTSGSSAAAADFAGDVAEEQFLSDTDVSAFREAWLQLKDTHDFYGLLRKFRLNREKAMHIAPEGHAVRIDTAKLKEVFGKASAAALPIMVFTGSPGCVQIHTGPVIRLVQTGPWLNVLDPDFNLHLREDGITSVWVVRKPTVDGIVTGIEAFDRNGELIVQLFGRRKPGIPEDERWHSLVTEVLKRF